MNRSSRAAGWLLVLAVALTQCAQGNDGDLTGGDQDGSAVDPDVKNPEDASDEDPDATDKEPDGSLDPTDTEAPLDADTPSDAAPLDASEAGFDAPDATTPDVPVVDADAPDAPVVPDAPDADAPDAPDAGTCPAGASMCGGACVEHGANPGTCAAAASLGNYCGDTSCGLLCPSTRYRTVATRTGSTSQWFRARVTECSVCPASVVARVSLTVPEGVDYDLFVHRPCGAIIGRSVALAGQPDQVQVSASESPLGDDGFEYFIEVRYVSGASCAPWTLTLEARSASASGC